ncbi:MAG: hypothetical protein KDD43_01670, partial [Bdellovibrionales bacterium]|nr:hypothetical protein [Bdellovibrionales bacterium]
SQIGAFADARVNMARAVIEGMSVQKIEGSFIRKKVPGDSIERKWWVPKNLRYVSRDRVRRSIHPDRNGRRWWRWNIFDPYLNKWLPISDESKFIWSFYRASEENLGYGEGLGKSVYSMLKLKVVLQELLAAGAERWVDSWVTVKLDETLRGESFLHNDENVDTLIDRIAKLRAHGILFYQGADIGTMAGSTGTTSQTILDMIEKIDREITILLTATNLPTDIGDVGAYAAVQGQMEQQNKRLMFQRRSIIEEPLNNWLLWNFFNFNRHNFAAMGMKNHERPSLRLSGGEVLNVDERIQAFDFALTKAQIDISEEDIRAGLKISTVTPGDKVVKPPKPESVGGFKTTTTAFQEAIKEELPDSDQRDDLEDLNKALENLGEATLKMSIGQTSMEELKAQEKKVAGMIQKMLVYFDLKGRESIIKEVEDSGEGEEVESK